jgi:putative phage-type endonuclease
VSAAASDKRLAVVMTHPPAWMKEVEARVTRFNTRADWLKARGAGVGGSEAAIIMGASSWGSPYSLWQEKAGLVPPDDNDNDVLRFGRVVEPLIADEYERLSGRQLVSLGDWSIRRHPTLESMFASHDRIIAPVKGKDGPGVLSIKSANVWKGEEWLDGEEPPLAYQVQFQHELACSGFRWGSFAVLIWGRGVRWLDMERNDGFIAVLEEECERFWQRVVKGDPPPVDGSEHTTAALRRLYPADAGGRVDLPPEAVDWAERLDVLHAEIKTREAEKEELNNRVRALLKDASEGWFPNGPAWRYKLEGAKPAGVIPEQEVPAYPGHRVLRRVGKKKGK